MTRRVNCSHIPVVDDTIKKWMIIPVVGQSNAVGYDESPVDLREFPANPRIKQLGYHRNNLQIVDLGHSADNYQDMSSFRNNGGPAGTKGIHYHLAKKCLEFIPQDYGILIIPAAYGGTTIAQINSSAAKGVSPTAAYEKNKSKYWELNPTTLKLAGSDARHFSWAAAPDGSKVSTVVEMTIKRIKKIIDEYPGSKLLGVVWCQGEMTSNKAGAYNENPCDTNLTNNELILAEYTKLITGVLKYVYRLGIRAFDGHPISRRDFYIYESTVYWNTSGASNVAQYNAICNLYKKMLPGNNYIKVCQGDGFTNAVNGTGQTSSARRSHYGNNAFRIIGPAVAAAIGKRFKGIKGVE